MVDVAVVGTLTGVMGLVSAALALAFAGVVYRSNPAHVGNRRLALLLTLEAVMLLNVSVPPLPFLRATLVGLYLPFVALTVLASAYLWFCTTLDSPLAQRARRPAVRAAIVGAPFAALLLSLVFGLRAFLAGATVAELEADLLVGLPWMGYGLSCVAALVFSYDAYRASPQASPSRRRARAYAWAFGLRDGFYVLGIFGWGLSEMAGLAQREALQAWLAFAMTCAPALFVSLLSYGILSTQLFDIDLRIKLGIQRSTVATIGLVGVLAAAKVAEFYLNKTYGFVAGGIAAGTLLVLAPRLNKLGDKVANAAMPQVQPTSAYVQFKKLEVYRAAVEAAQEAGVSERERQMLDKLRAKLGIDVEDARAVEAEAVGAGA